MKLKALSSVIIMTLCGITFTHAEQKIPMSNSYYQGKYFLLSNKKSGTINTVIYKANFNEETVFSKMEINCVIGKIRATGEGINSLKDLRDFDDKGKWSTPVYESTRSDVVKFACQ